MKRIIALLTAIIALPTIGQDFVINDLSQAYRAVISVSSCDQDTCKGNGKLTLNKDKFSQTFDSEDLHFFLDEPLANINELYGRNSPVRMEDFNFDGKIDLALRNGNEGGYGGPSYDIYVQTQSGKFVFSDELSELTHAGALGLFDVDEQNRLLSTFYKSGAAWHQRVDWQVVPRQGLRKVREITWEYTSDGEVQIKDRRLIKGKWKTHKWVKKGE